MNFKLLKDLYKIHSKTGFEGEIICFIYRWVNENVPSAVIDLDWDNGNLYITKGVSNTYPCLVAHLDQVQSYHPTDFRAIETREIIFGYSPKDRQYCGLGADDKNGIWIALKCLQKYDTLKVAFFISEEIGCVGSREAKMSFFENVRFVVEPDRKGSSDVIVKICYTDLCSKEFLYDTQYENYGYSPTSGMMTDIEELKGKGLGVSCINLSCGYYSPHTDQEYTVKKDLLKALRFVENIIENCTQVYHHKTQDYLCPFEADSDMDIRDELYSMIEEEVLYDDTITPDDLFWWYHESYPEITLDDIAQIYHEVREGIYGDLEVEYKIAV